jgi:hypothetical protein
VVAMKKTATLNAGDGSHSGAQENPTRLAAMAGLTRC